MDAQLIHKEIVNNFVPSSSSLYHHSRAAVKMHYVIHRIQTLGGTVTGFEGVS